MSFPSAFNNPKKNMQTEDEIEQIEHKYPFKANVRIDKTSINEQQVSVNVRRPSEFNIEARIVFDPEYKQRLLALWSKIYPVGLFFENVDMSYFEL